MSPTDFAQGNCEDTVGHSQAQHVSFSQVMCQSDGRLRRSAHLTHCQPGSFFSAASCSAAAPRGQVAPGYLLLPSDRQASNCFFFCCGGSWRSIVSGLNFTLICWSRHHILACNTVSAQLHCCKSTASLSPLQNVWLRSSAVPL